MLKLVFLIAALALSVSPLDARERPKEDKKMERTHRGDLHRDVERISKEIYPPPKERRRR